MGWSGGVISNRLVGVGEWRVVKGESMRFLSFANLVLVGSVLCAVTAWAQTPLGTAFTYQGELRDAGTPADGQFDFVFSLHDDQNAGSQIGSSVVVEDVPVSDGVFTAEIDFGDVFDGTEFFIQLGVRPGASTGSFTILSPRQTLNATPNAQFALNGSSGGVLRPRYTTVAGSGGEYTTPAAALADVATWCGTPSAANRCVVRIFPGIYDQGAGSLDLVSFVDLQGSGRESTVISAVGIDQDPENGGTVVGADDVTIRDLTIENLGGAEVYGIAVRTSSNNLRFERVILRAVGAAITGGQGPVDSNIVLVSTMAGSATLVDVIIDHGGGSGILSVPSLMRSDQGLPIIGELRGGASLALTLHDVSYHIPDSVVAFAIQTIDTDLLVDGLDLRMGGGVGIANGGSGRLSVEDARIHMESQQPLPAQGIQISDRPTRGDIKNSEVYIDLPNASVIFGINNISSVARFTNIMVDVSGGSMPNVSGINAFNTGPVEIIGSVIAANGSGDNVSGLRLAGAISGNSAAITNSTFTALGGTVNSAGLSVGSNSSVVMINSTTTGDDYGVLQVGGSSLVNISGSLVHGGTAPTFGSVACLFSHDLTFSAITCP